MTNKPYQFNMDDRLGIPLPYLTKDWDSFSPAEQDAILSEWESIRGRIPDRIKQLEGQIEAKQKQLNQEEDFHQSCELNSEISELASIINDLHLWYRAQNEIDEGKRH